MPVAEAELLAWLLEGQAALEAGRSLDAAHAFRRVHHALPHDYSVAQMLANAWRLAGRVAEERRALQDMWALVVAHTMVLDVPTTYELGTRLLAVGGAEEARACFAQVVTQRPRDPSALGALASATRAAGDPVAAWPIVQQALALAPTLPALLLTASQVQHALGNLAGAHRWLDQADAVRPNHGPTQLQRGHTSLLGGISAAGWAGFEHRGLPAPRHDARPWRGEPLAGQSIVVVGDQGVGDQFHFARFIPLLAERGASRVVFSCHPGAVSLFRASGFDAMTADQVPPCHWAVPLLSLPHYLATDRNLAQHTIPYLRTSSTGAAPPPVVPGAPRRLGLVWKGNPDFLATGLRDFDAALLPALMDIPNIEWVWLQYGEAPTFQHPALTVPPLSSDWHDSAVLLATLHGVVSVDTSMAHLAGAMGLPGYVLLPYSPDWRWGLGQDVTPWYPSLTLLRQPTPKNWAAVVHELHQRLTWPG
jgi:tetratricopeptide (TPR) repeat protein